MGRELPSSEIYSHPRILLEEHLFATADLAERFLAEKDIRADGELKQVCRLVALLHDIGKATEYFQDYLRAVADKKSLERNRETRHSLFSAVCAYYLTKASGVTAKFYPLFAFLAVKRHHGDLRDVLDDVIFNEEDKELLSKQLDAIPSDRFSILTEKLSRSGVPAFNKSDINSWIEGFPGESRELRRELRRPTAGMDNYVLLNLLFSLLIDADKSAVIMGNYPVFTRRAVGGPEWVDNYRQQEKFPPSPLNPMRNQVYKETTGQEIDLKQKIYSLNVPTGLGKTLTAFAFALKLRRRIEAEHQKKARIIYALPYLSIIEQNADVLDKVIKSNNLNTDSSLFLKHHHLTEVFYRTPENEYESDAAELLIEGWNSEIIITTFVQLFHTLISNRNRSLRKFHRLGNAIIILDEVQAVPIKYWLLLRDVLTTLAERLNSYVILVTATQPLIFEETTQLVKDRERYFKSLNRVIIKPTLAQPMMLNELINQFNFNDGRSYLFILNTITSAREFYNLVKKKGLSATYLSTHIVPCERFKRIEEIKKGNHRIAVTTQLVEAGVDIDFDVVVRDIAPLDSINQAAGRCNRNSRKKGEIYVVKLVNQNQKPYASYIYDPVLLQITEDALARRRELREGDFLDLIQEYYKETKSRMSQDESRTLCDAITHLRYEGEGIQIANFQLIEEDYTKFDVFVAIDDQAEQVWHRYISLQEIIDPFTRKSEFDKFKADFYQYVISLPRNITNRPQLIGAMGYVGREQLPQYYDPETGYITKERNSVIVW